MDLQNQYNFIHSFFKTTNEPFDYLDWDGNTIDVWQKNKKLESYSLSDLKENHNERKELFWKSIFAKYKIHQHNFKNGPFLIEAKNSKTSNTIIRQLFYPYRQWSQHTSKPIKILFFEKRNEFYSLWQFEFSDLNDYNSIRLNKSCRYEIIEK